MENKKITIDYETYTAIYTYLLGFKRIVERIARKEFSPTTKELGTNLANSIQELLAVLEEVENV